MRFDVDVDDALAAEAMATLGTKTLREAIEVALRDTVRAARQRKAFEELRGIGWEGDLDDMRTSKYLPAAE